ncbi:4676_t:CDS:2, partial [Dentiscutata heterogama]
MDETGLFYSLAPDHTIVSRQIEGLKKDKVRITIALMANADDRDEASKNDIYKVDQLQVSVETIKNCWAHTKIVLSRNKTRMLIVSSLSIVYIENAKENISVETNIDNKNKGIEKNNEEQFTDDDFVQGTIEIEQVEEKEAMELSLTLKEQLNILYEALKIVVEMVEDNEATIRSLHKVQAHIYEEIRKEKNEQQ